MPSRDDAVQAVLDQLETVARNPRIPDAAKSVMVLRLAEAYAWLTSPDQPHGSSAPAPAGRSGPSPAV